MWKFSEFLFFMGISNIQQFLYLPTFLILIFSNKFFICSVETINDVEVFRVAFVHGNVKYIAFFVFVNIFNFNFL